MSGAAAEPVSKRPAQRRAAGSEPIDSRWIETFAEGSYDGDQPGEVWEYGPEELQTIVRNFEALSAGDDPTHKVPVIVTHDGTQAYGWVKSARIVGERLDTQWAKVQPPLVDAIRAGRFEKCSAEIRQDFADRKGNVTPGPYIYRVAVLGADVPRVKGLADLSKSFADAAGRRGRWITRTFKFADPRGIPMTREQAIQFLTQMGLDPNVMGADVPDAFLIAVATAWQEAETAEHDDPDNPTPPANPPPVPPVTGPANPKKVTVSQTFSDPAALSKFIRREIQRATDPALKRINDAAAAETAAREQRAAEERQGAVRLFCDQRAKEGKISPADNDEKSAVSIRSRLLRVAAQPPVTHKFADPAAPGDRSKDTSKTELQLQLEEIDARPPRQFSERVRQGAAGAGAGAGGAEPDYTQSVQARCAEKVKRAADRGTLRGPTPSLN